LILLIRIDFRLMLESVYLALHIKFRRRSVFVSLVSQKRGLATSIFISLIYF
jgi:hypothetical protein